MCAMYGSIDYWNNRYKQTEKEKPCEWYRSYAQFSYLLHSSILSSMTSNSVTGSVLPNTATTVPLHVPSPFLFHKQLSTSSTMTSEASGTTHSQSSSDQFPERSQARILIAGCGNSSLPFDMIQDGWTGGIVCVDFSSVVIQQMKSKRLHSQIVSDASLQQSKNLDDVLDFICADVTQPLIGYTTDSFDLILVKGTFDAILCSDSSRSNATKFIQNCVQLLSSNHGVLFMITTGNPDNRLEYLEYQNELTYYWRNVSVHPLRSQNHPLDGGQPSFVQKGVHAEFRLGSRP